MPPKRRASSDGGQSPAHKRTALPLNFVLQSFPSSHIPQDSNQRRESPTRPVHYQLDGRRAQVTEPRLSNFSRPSSAASAFSDLLVQLPRPTGLDNSQRPNPVAVRDIQIAAPSRVSNPLPPDTNPYFAHPSPPSNPWDKLNHLTVCDCFEGWAQWARYPGSAFPPISERALSLRSQTRESVIRASDVRTGSGDLQGINWSILGTNPEWAHLVRKYLHKSQYDTENPAFQPPHPTPLSKTPLDQFHFKQMTTTHVVPRVHHQLRHLFTAPSSASYFYATGSRICRASPGVPDSITVFDIETQSKDVSRGWRPLVHPAHSTGLFCSLGANSQVVVAGNWAGKYALQSLAAPLTAPWATGDVPDAVDSYINHIAVSRARRTGAPIACLSTKNSAINILDCGTNRFIAIHKLGYSPNATAPSPDARLRLVVGDSPKPVILDAETGHVAAELPPHADFGFTCAWSPDGQFLATGHQDRRVQIFDTRRWDRAVQVFQTEMGGLAALDFSPGNGADRVLLVAESSDCVHLLGGGGKVEGRGQTVGFLGEVTGAEFVGGGDGNFVVACADPNFGGVIEWGRMDDAGVRRDQSWF